VQQWGLAGHGGAAQITVLVEANVPAWIFVAPRSCRSDFWLATGAFNYVLTIHGPTVTTTSATWGLMKSLFR
jgi:hypothetical protein